MEGDFRLADVNHSPAFFDLKKLAAFNGEYIRALSPSEFLDAARPWLTAADAPYPVDRFSDDVFLAMAPHVQPRCVTLADAPGLVDFLFVAEVDIDAASWAKATGTPEGAAVLREASAAYDALGSWDAGALKSTLEEIGERHGLKLGKAQAPVRVAVTGRSVGPPLFESLECLGRDETMRRLRAAEELLA
jgi:glutamyl-tRNA synthetase